MSKNEDHRTWDATPDGKPDTTGLGQWPKLSPQQQARGTRSAVRQRNIKTIERRVAAELAAKGKL